MLDTVKLTLDRYTVRKDNALTVSRNYVRGEEQDLRCLFPLEGGGIEHGSKAYLNAPAFNFDVKRLGKNTLNASVHFSAPKVVSGSNYQPADLKTFERSLEIVEQGLREAGVETDLTEARLQRVDITKNAPLIYPVPDYAPVFELLHGSRMKDRREYPSGFLLKNSVREVCLYDKRVLMLQNKEDVSGVPENVLRVEVRALDTRTASRMLELQTAGDVLKRFDRVPEMYETVVKDLFKHDPVQLTHEYQTKLERVFRAELNRNEKHWIQRAVKRVGAEAIFFSLGGEEGLRRMFYNLGLKKQHVYRNVKQITEACRDSISQESFFGGVTVSELYNEIKYKLVA
jgi:hypothetical protein